MKINLILLLSFTFVIFSCDKENDHTTASASFLLSDEKVEVVSNHNQIITGTNCEMQPSDSGKCNVTFYSSIAFTVGNKSYVLKTDYIMLVDSSKVNFDGCGYKFKNPTDYFEKISALSGKFIELPDTSHVFESQDTYLNLLLDLIYEIETFRKEGFIVQLFDETNDEIYITDLAEGSNAGNEFKITNTWKEEGINGGNDLLFVTCKFDLELTNIKNKEDKILLKNGTCNFWTLDN